MTPALRVLALVSLLLAESLAAAAPRACLSECTPRIGVVSAFGEEAAILVRETRGARTWTINGNRFTTGTLRGNRVVIVLSGVSMINAAMTTQTLIDHFRIERLIMSGISGGIDPAHRVGDVLVPETWAMPMEVYWHHDSSPPAPCGAAGDLSCLGLRIARVDGKPVVPFTLPGGAATGLFIRENHATRPGGAPRASTCSTIASTRRCSRSPGRSRRRSPRADRRRRALRAARPTPKLCVGTQPRIVVGGRGVSGTAFLANPAYRRYLFDELRAQTVDMETAALAHVAYVNGIPYIAFRSLSDLAGAEFDADVGALFASGLAEATKPR